MIFKKIHHKVENSDFLKSFLTLFSGTFVSQLIPILISPILTRLYSPADIGLFSLYFTIASILSFVSTGRYYSAILIPKKEIEAKILFDITILLSFVFSVLFFLLIFFFNDGILKLLMIDPTTSSKGLYYVILIMLSYNIYVTYDSYCNRWKKYRLMATSKVLQNIFVSLAQISFCFFGWVGLLLGRILGQIISIIYFERKERFFNVCKIKFNTREKLKNMWVVGLKYKEYPFYSMPNSLVNSVSYNLPTLMLGRMFSIETTAYYSWATRIILTPMSMITTAMSQVFFQKISELKNSNISIYHLVRRTYFQLLLFSTIMFSIIGLFAPNIFAFVFGEEWRVAGKYTMYLIPWLILVFANNPISPLMLVLNKQKQFLIYECLLLSVRILVFVFGHISKLTADQIIILYSFTGFMFSAFFSVYLLRIVK